VRGGALKNLSPAAEHPLNRDGWSRASKGPPGRDPPRQNSRRRDGRRPRRSERAVRRIGGLPEARHAWATRDVDVLRDGLTQRVLKMSPFRRLAPSFGRPPCSRSLHARRGCWVCAEEGGERWVGSFGSRFTRRTSVSSRRLVDRRYGSDTPGARRHTRHRALPQLGDGAWRLGEVCPRAHVTRCTAVRASAVPVAGTGIPRSDPDGPLPDRDEQFVDRVRRLEDQGQVHAFAAHESA
jgi:hypothetical protein